MRQSHDLPQASCVAAKRTSKAISREAYTSMKKVCCLHYEYPIVKESYGV